MVALQYHRVIISNAYFSQRFDQAREAENESKVVESRRAIKPG